MALDPETVAPERHSIVASLVMKGAAHIAQGVPDGKQQIQEVMYGFPYHYVPTLEGGRFSMVRYCGMSALCYMGRIHVVLSQLKMTVFNSLIDVGCGDGRFLSEVAKRYPDARLLGVDYSEQAVKLAKALNPGLTFEAADIVRHAPAGGFDVATLIEVLEHIPPQVTEQFLIAIAGTLHKHGRLVLTVPHANMSLMKRHHQHFTTSHLREVLEPHFQEISLILLDPKSRVMRTIYRLLGGGGEHFVISNARLVTWFYQLYINHYLYTNDERICRRIAAVCQKSG